MVKIKLDDQLRVFTNFEKTVFSDGSNLEVILEDLIIKFPRLGRYLIDKYGKLRSFIRILVHGKDIDHLKLSKVRVKQNTVIYIRSGYQASGL